MQRLLASTIVALGLALAGAACQGKSASAPAQHDNAAHHEAAGAPATDQAPADPAAGQAAARSAGQATGPTADQAAVRKVFEDYKSAIMERRGNDAAALVDRNTLDFYARCRELALTAPRKTLLAESLFVRMTTLVLRVRVPVDKLAAMDARQMVVHAVDQGWVGDVANLGIGDITISGDKATGPAKVPDAPDVVIFQFHREDGAWKIDLTSIFSYADQALRQQFATMGKDENQAILELIDLVAEEPVTDNVWKPLR